MITFFFHIWMVILHLHIFFSPLFCLQTSNSLWKIGHFQPKQPLRHSVAMACSHLHPLTSRWYFEHPRVPWRRCVGPAGGLRGVHILDPRLQWGSGEPAESPGGCSVCGRQGQAAASSSCPCEGGRRDAVPDIQGFAEKAPQGTKTNSASQTTQPLTFWVKICFEFYFAHMPLVLRVLQQMHFDI